MSMPDSLANLVGHWTGINHLWLTPEEPMRQSASSAIVALAAQGQFLTLQYTWVYEGVPQDGLLVLGIEKITREAQAFWIDSWHMQNKFMACAGHAADQGHVSVKGSYNAPPGPDWGWQIDIMPQSKDAFDMVMYNITPEGEAFLAVKAAYAR